MLGDYPVAEPRGAAGSRSNIIISVRRERPSSSVRPEAESCPFRFGVVSLGTCLWVAPIGAGDGGQQAAPAGRSDCGSLWDLNAGRSADQRCWVDAPRARVNG